jgi:hypothetical protein
MRKVSVVCATSFRKNSTKCDENRARRSRFVALSNSTLHSKTRRTFLEVTAFFDAECDVSVKLVKFISAFAVVLQMRSKN